MTNNIRFWTYANGAMVKLTLHPGAELHHYQGGRTEEGWNSLATTYRLSNDASTLEREYVSDGSDCDGRLTQGNAQIANADRDTYVATRDGDALLSRPDWQDASAWQRDQYAELMNY